MIKRIVEISGGRTDLSVGLGQPGSPRSSSPGCALFGEKCENRILRQRNNSNYFELIRAQTLSAQELAEKAL